MVRRAVRIVALGDTMASRLVHGKGADPGKITVIHNWADTIGDRAVARSAMHSPPRTGSMRQFVVLHAGQHRAVARISTS